MPQPMRHALLLLFVVALPGLAADRQSVMNLLEGYEWRLDAEGFQSLGADAYLELLAIAGDKGELNMVRGRALAALTLYPNQQVWLFFADRVAKPGDEPVLRRRAVDAMCETFTTARAQEVAAVLMPLLEDGDAHLRIAAAKCLRGIGDDSSNEALRAYRQTIEDSWEARAAGFPDEIP